MVQFLFEMLIGFIWWIVLLPVIWLLATPLILVGSLFSGQSYGNAVMDKYRKVTRFWSEWGIYFSP
jgi:hypothetical protein